MSDGFEYWFFPELERQDVRPAKSRILEGLWSGGLLETENNPNLVLGGKEAYGPTPKLQSLFSKPDNLGGVSLTLQTRGMEVCEGFGFKGWELNDIDKALCPACHKSQPLESFEIFEAIEKFHETEIIPNISCKDCGLSQDVRKIESEPKLTFTYLGFAFWNWPPLNGFPADEYNSAGIWQIDIPALMENLAQSPISYSYGRV